MQVSQLPKNIIGDIGEDLPLSDFTNVRNLNSIHPNFPGFDMIAEKDGETYVFSIKCRKKYGANGKLNSAYNICNHATTFGRKIKKALDLLTTMGYDIALLHYCFLVAPLEEDKDCVYYWGEFTEINPKYTMDNIITNQITSFDIKVSDKYLSSYTVYGTHTWETIKNKYIGA